MAGDSTARVEQSGDVGELFIGGSLGNEGDNVITLRVQGAIGRIGVGGRVSAAGAGSEPRPP
jgi:hypothetical protein